MRTLLSLVAIFAFTSSAMESPRGKECSWSICCSAAFFFLLAPCNDGGTVQIKYSSEKRNTLARRIRKSTTVDNELVSYVASLEMPETWRSGKRAAFYSLSWANDGDIYAVEDLHDFSSQLSSPQKFISYLNFKMPSSTNIRAVAIQTDQLTAPELFSVIKSNINERKPLIVYTTNPKGFELVTVVGYEEKDGSEPIIILLPDNKKISLATLYRRSKLKSLKERLAKLVLEAAFSRVENQNSADAFELFKNLQDFNLIVFST